MFPSGAPGDSLTHPESDAGDNWHDDNDHEHKVFGVCEDCVAPVDRYGTPEHEEWLIEMEEEDERWSGHYGC